MHLYSPSSALVAHVKASEGCRLSAYKCPRGVWTIGYGHTEGVKHSDHITQLRAEHLLIYDLKAHYARLAPHVKVPLSDAQWDALVDMAFNVGVGAVAGSTLLRYINARRSTPEIKAQFLRWNKAGGRVLPGLTKRCEWRARRWGE